MSDDLRTLRLAVADDICLISRLSGIAVAVAFLPSDAVNEKRPVTRCYKSHFQLENYHRSTSVNSQKNKETCR